ncbi:MAG: 50S ribosomal protein L25/general stress protein Ctc [Promicromonosporaceae bacterium]|nr:50S ribosomal protein L25/general stress protein Ctc [Promicromonosporaceae bacterium]
MAEIKLAAQARTKFGKGAARQTRRDGRIPAVLYGHGTDPLHVSLPAHDTMLALRQANALFSIELDGNAQLAVAKDVQRDPVRQIIEHVDLLIVKAGEKIAVEVPIVLVGDAMSGSITLLDMQTLSIEAEATNIPKQIEIDVTGLTVGTVITAGEVKYPAGATGLDAADAPVVRITEPQAETEATEGEGDDAAEAAE